MNKTTYILCNKTKYTHYKSSHSERSYSLKL